MTLYLVSRHPGAIDWMRTECLRGRDGATPVQILDHLDDDQSFVPGDTVAGVLPLHWAARIHAAGATVLSLEFRVDRLQRGRELDAQALRTMGARLVRYRVERVDDTPPGSVVG